MATAAPSKLKSPSLAGIVRLKQLCRLPHRGRGEGYQASGIKLRGLKMFDSRTT